MTTKQKEMKVANLAAVVADDAVSSLARQRESLNQFIKTQLKESVDYGVIPGTPKPTLFKPGAEKLANIFQLGSRIVHSDTKLDHEKRFAMCSYTIELYHLPTGKTLAQCEGSTNSLERRYQKQDTYSILNTLQKMAQKRAFVGAVIQACNASDFFTQDLEDMDIKDIQGKKEDALAVEAQGEVGLSTLIRWGKYKGKSVGEAAKDPKFLSYCDWIIQQSEGKKDKQNFLAEALSWRTALDEAAEAIDEKDQSHTEHKRVA